MGGAGTDRAIGQEGAELHNELRGLHTQRTKRA